MKTILIPLDFSPTSAKAVEYVENVFRNEPVQLELIYVSSADDLIEAGTIIEAFEQFERDTLKKYDIPYSFDILKGNLLDKIQETIILKKPFLVIMGTHKASLAKAIVKLTDSPVLIIPDKSAKKEIRNIAYANDFKNIKVSSALEPLLNLSRSFGAKVHVVHLNKDTVLPADEAESSIEYYLEHVDHEYVGIQTDNFVSTIQDYLKDQNIDLLAILIRDHGKNALHTEGALLEELVEKSNVPILSLV
jgi:hypothetical protein